MDEAVAGHATRIELELAAGNRVTVRDNGRGIPIDPHPKFPDKSALEVIMTTLHSGGKFGSKAYETSGGLHGVGVSVVNALASELVVEVARNRSLYAQRYARGLPLGPLAMIGAAPNRRGTTDQLRPRHRDLRPGRPLPARAPAPDGAQQGLSVPRRRDPLALRPGAARAGLDRAGRGQLPFPARPRRLPEGAARRPRAGRRRPVHRRGGAGAGRARRVGDRLADRRGDLHRLVLQHRADAARRHATRPACATRCSRACAPTPSGSASSAPARSPPTT